MTPAITKRRHGERTRPVIGGAAVASVGALLAAASKHHLAGRIDRAGALYDQVLAADPRNVKALCLKGVILYEGGDLDAGAKLLRRATRIRPYFAEAHDNLGTVAMYRGDYDTALK